MTYVLVADGQEKRMVACVEALEPFHATVRVARDGEEAIHVFQRFGVPILLIVDLSLAEKDGFAVIEAVSAGDGGRAEIIAWSSSRELREFAAHRLSGSSVRILGSAFRPVVLRRVIERAFQAAAWWTPPDSSLSPGRRDSHQIITELSQKALRLCGTPGVAVYLRASGDTQFRASVTWTADVPVPRWADHVPRIFRLVLETGEPSVLPDFRTLSDVAGSTVQEGGVAAVPIRDIHHHVVGMICVFDVKSLTFDSADLEALVALGRRVSVFSQLSAETADEAPRGSQEAVRRQRHAARSQPRAVSTSPIDRRAGDLAIARELAGAYRLGQRLSVVMFEVDSLASDNRDAVAGSTREPVIAVGQTLLNSMRASDLTIRWNPYELLVVLPGAGIGEARHVAQRVCAVIERTIGDSVDVSGGVAELLPDENIESLIARAVRTARWARAEGRNRVAD